MDVCGLDISSHMLRFVELSPRKRGSVKSFIPVRWGAQPLPEGVVVAGEVANKDGLIKALKAFKKTHKLRFVKVSLPEEKAYLFKTTVPTIDESEFADAAAFTLEENVPIAGADALMEWDVVERRPAETVLSVSVFPRDTAAAFLDALRAAGLTPVALDIKVRVMAKAVIPRNDPRNFMVVSIGDTKTVLCIVSNGVAQFTSTVFTGSAAFTSAIQKHRNCTLEEARALRHSANFLQSAGIDDKAIKQEFMAILDRLDQEIRRVYAYWYMRKDNDEKTKKINALVVTGGDALMPGLVDYMSAHQDVPVEVANVWQNCFSLDAYIPELPFEESIKYCIAIGLALP